MSALVQKRAITSDMLRACFSSLAPSPVWYLILCVVEELCGVGCGAARGAQLLRLNERQQRRLRMMALTIACVTASKRGLQSDATAHAGQDLAPNNADRAPGLQGAARQSGTGRPGRGWCACIQLKGQCCMHVACCKKSSRSMLTTDRAPV